MNSQGSRNAQLMRELNERIVEILREVGSEDGEIAQFLCECSNVTCFGTIDLTLQEYAALRAREEWLKLPGHVD
jgi:hypothetical protein